MVVTDRMTLTEARETMLRAMFPHTLKARLHNEATLGTTLTAAINQAIEARKWTV